jgi:hypothetical protein
VFEQLLLQDAIRPDLSCDKLFLVYEYCSTILSVNLWTSISDLALIIGLTGMGLVAYMLLSQRRLPSTKGDE